MRLNEALITSFNYEDKEYDIDLTFDNVLDVYDYLGDKTLREYERTLICLDLLLGNGAYDETKAVDLWNYIYESFIHIKSHEPIEYDRKGNPMPSKKGKQGKHMDLEVDAKYIYASFMQAYGINLFHEQGKMHWLEFQSLLTGLPSNTIMQRIIEIRKWKPKKGDSKEHRKEMEELQRIYALDDEDENGEVDE